MTFRQVILTALFMVCAGLARAADVALVIDNGGRDRIVAAADRLDAAGVAVVAGSDRDAGQMRAMLSQIEQMARSADGLVVILSGRFVHSREETYFLATGGEGAGLAAVAQDGLALSAILAVLAEMPGRAVLALAPDGDDGEAGPFLRQGIGAPNLPQGVTSITGRPDAVARMVRDALAVPGAGLVETAETVGGISIDGYAPRGFAFLPDGGGDVDRLRRRVQQAEQDVATAREGARTARDRLADADSALWAAARADDRAEGYRRYLEVFPTGENVSQARRALNAIRDEPFRAARLEEEGMDLNRARRQEIQRDLTALGFDTRGVDGIFGPGTRTAISAWQQRRDARETGYLDAAQVTRLRQAAEARTREVAAQRAEGLRADRRFWEQTGAGGDAAGLRRYLGRFPEGQFADPARRALAALETPARPTGKKDDRLAWRQTVERNTASGYRAFLRAHPDSSYVDNARARLRGIEGVGGREDAARRAEDALGLTPILRRTVEGRLKAMGGDPGGSNQ